LENEYPILVDRYEIRNDSGGAGKYRGGLGFRRDYLILQETSFSSHGDRQKFAPWGLFGGKPGDVGRFVINPDTDKEHVLPSGKMSDIELKKGDIMSAQTAGSGGFGEPFERDVNLVIDDVINEKVSLENARKLYGVVIDIDKRKVDIEATNDLRRLK
jgi:N-methylhydantoinase B